MTDPQPALTIVDLVSPGDAPELLRSAFDTVLRPSFGPDELGGIETVEPSPDRVVTIASVDGVPMGVAVSECDPGGISLLSHLAVNPASRGLGVGARLLEHLRGVWSHVGLVLAEVHDPRGHADTPSEHPEARLRFYGRAGARVLGVPFVQPAIGPGAERVRDMLLLVLHPADVDAIEPAALVEWIRRYYVAAEGAVPTDPQGLDLLARAGAGDTVAVLPLERWREVVPLSR